MKLMHNDFIREGEGRHINDKKINALEQSCRESYTACWKVNFIEEESAMLLMIDILIKYGINFFYYCH